MKFDLLVEEYLSLYLESHEEKNFSPENQVFLPRFEKDVKKVNGNPQIKTELKNFFNAWDSNQYVPKFEIKHQTKDISLAEPLKAIFGREIKQFPIYAVEIRKRRPSLHLLCTVIDNRLVWLRACLGYDNYEATLTSYRNTT
jgi:hypothetical protein